jgi:hypothetical protein
MVNLSNLSSFSPASFKNLSKQLIQKYNYRVTILHPKRSRLFSRLVWSFAVITQALFISAKNKPQLIHSHGYLPGISGKILSIISRKKMN